MSASTAGSSRRSSSTAAANAYSIGHKRRRKEGIPLLETKFRTNVARRFPREQQDRILAVSLDQQKLEGMAVNEYVDLYVI